MSDTSNRRVTVLSDADLKKVKSQKTEQPPKSKTKKASQPLPAATAPTAGSETPVEGQPCPLCGKGRIIRGKTAYGCSEWKSGCTYRLPFT